MTISGVYGVLSLGQFTAENGLSSNRPNRHIITRTVSCRDPLHDRELFPVSVVQPQITQLEDKRQPSPVVTCALCPTMDLLAVATQEGSLSIFVRAQLAHMHLTRDGRVSIQLYHALDSWLHWAHVVMLPVVDAIVAVPRAVVAARLFPKLTSAMAGSFHPPSRLLSHCLHGLHVAGCMLCTRLDAALHGVAAVGDHLGSSAQPGLPLPHLEPRWCVWLASAVPKRTCVPCRLVLLLQCQGKLGWCDGVGAWAVGPKSTSAHFALRS